MQYTRSLINRDSPKKEEGRKKKELAIVFTKKGRHRTHAPDSHISRRGKGKRSSI